MAAEVRKRKLRPWAEAARLVLGVHEALPITDIFERIKERGLRDTTPGSKECLFSMMRAHSRGQHSMFYRRLDPGSSTICFGLRNDLPPSTAIVETDTDTDDESQKHDSRFKPKVQLLKSLNENENVAPDGNIIQLPLKRRSVLEEPPPKRCLRPKPQRISDERSTVDDQSSTTDRTSSPTNSSSGEESLSHFLNQRTVNGFQTMREMLNHLSESCGIKLNRRPPKKSSMSQQLEETRKGYIDLETSDSILVSVNIKELLSNYAFSLLPKHLQQKLLGMLPQVDRKTKNDEIHVDSALNNEFFASACQEWRERLMDGDLTPESQLKQKAEYERHLRTVDSWKMRNFEEVWGAKSITTDEDMEQYEQMRQLHEKTIAEAQLNAIKKENKSILETNDSMTTSTILQELSSATTAPLNNISLPPPPPPPLPASELKTRKESSDVSLELEEAKVAAILPNYSSTLHKVLAEHGVPVSSNHRRKCNNIVPPSLCLSAKRVGLSLLAPPKVFLHAPIVIPRRRLRFCHHLSQKTGRMEVLKSEYSRRFRKECQQLEEHLDRLGKYLENPAFISLPVPLDVQELLVDVVNLVDLDRIQDYSVYCSNSYATSTVGTPSHAGTTVDENFGSELTFSVATDEEQPTDDMSDVDAIGSELSGSRPHTAIDHEGSIHMTDDAQDILSEDDTREATTPVPHKTNRLDIGLLEDCTNLQNEHQETQEIMERLHIIKNNHGEPGAPFEDDDSEGSPDCIILDEENFSDQESPEILTSDQITNVNIDDDCFNAIDTNQDKGNEGELNDSVEIVTDYDLVKIDESGNLQDLPKEEGEPSGDDNSCAHRNPFMRTEEIFISSCSSSDATVSDDDTDIETPGGVQKMTGEADSVKNCDVTSDSTIEEENDADQSISEDCSMSPMPPIAVSEVSMIPVNSHVDENPGQTSFVADGLTPPLLPQRCKAHSSSHKKRKRALSCRDLLIAVEQRKKEKQKEIAPCCLQSSGEKRKNDDGSFSKLQPMLPCQRCGAFWHSDCIGPSRICSTCLLV